MIKYMKENYGNRPGANEGERQELQFLSQEVQKMKMVMKEKGKSKSTHSDEESSGSDSEGDMVEELPVVISQSKGPKPRMSVSAEVFGKFNVEKIYEPPVYPKKPEDAAAIKNRMKNNFMFSALNPKDSKAILDAIVQVKKAPGEVVIKEGDDGDNFYLVESGELTCTKFLNPDDKEETFLKTYVPGESFGELALLYNAPRAATIIAKTDAELWSLERGTFNSIIKTAV